MGNSKSGRTSEYTEEMADKICDLVASGSSVNAIGRMKDMPEANTIRKWLDAQPIFSTRFAHARDLQADWFFDRIGELASGATDATERVRRLQIDTLKWTAGKLKPTKYGDRQQLDVNLDMNLRAMSDEDLRATIVKMAAEIGVKLGDV